MVEELLIAAAAVGSAAVVYVAAAARVVKQYERGVVFRLGRLRGGPRTPGFTMVVPGIDHIRKVNMQIVTMPVPAQEGITRDNVTVRVDAVVYFKVVDAANAVIQVEDYRFAVSQMAQTSLRSIIGKSDLDDLLSNREKLNQGLELMIDSPAVEWGVTIDRVEIKNAEPASSTRTRSCRHPRSSRRPPNRCPSSPPPSNSACCRRWWRSPPRRTPPSCSPSRWSCSASWNGPRQALHRTRLHGPIRLPRPHRSRPLRPSDTGTTPPPPSPRVVHVAVTA